MIGKTLGHYQITNQLGKGGMGEVYQVKDQTIRYATQQAKLPVYVTENGIGTEDDTRRIEYTRRALAGVAACLGDKIDVRGYIHWSLMDNFEWTSGYRPKFGLVAINRNTLERTPKPSAKWLGSIAKRNSF